MQAGAWFKKEVHGNYFHESTLVILAWSHIVRLLLSHRSVINFCVSALAQESGLVT